MAEAGAGQARGSGLTVRSRAGQASRGGTHAARMDARITHLKQKVLEAILTRGPCCSMELSRWLNTDQYGVQRALKSLTYHRQIHQIGTAWDAHRGDLNANARLWAPVGTPLLPQRPLADDDEHDAPPRRVADPERLAQPRRIGRGLGGWGGWGQR